MKKQALSILFFFKLQTPNPKLQTPNSKLFLLYSLLLSPLLLFSQPKIQLEDYATGFLRPVDIAHCGDSRLFIVEQRGYIWILDSLGNRLQDTFLNIDARVRSTGNEQGLLGLAFPPDYAETGYFFVNYTRETDGDTHVSRFKRDSLNPNKADPNSELIILTQDQPFTNHNGGCLKFGPDGYLYIALGDGGSGGDPQNNGQKKNTFLGKILRIDVSNSSASLPYTVPPDNPFVNDAAYFPEIWSLGLRNPWRFSFDRLTGDMWIGDVGQGDREEIDFEPANTGGRNYGWRCYEGSLPYNTSACLPASNYIAPVFDYDNSSLGCSVTGGFVYRGSKYPDLFGKYIFTDYCSGRWWVTTHNADGTFSTVQIADLANSQYSSLGEDHDGNLYVALLASGKIQKIKELCSPFQISLVNIISPVCANNPGGLLEINAAGGASPVNYAWSNGEPGNIISYLYPGAYSVTTTDANGCVRLDTFEIEQIGPDVPTLTASDTILCAGQSVTLTASGLPSPNTLQWYRDGQVFTTTSSSDSSFALAVTEPGEYEVLLVDTLCNLLSQQIFIDEEFVILPIVALFGDTVIASGSWASYQWLLDGEIIPGATGEFHVATESGFYQCQCTSSTGCVYTDGIQVEISGTVLPPNMRRFSLAPNPTRDEMLLNLELEKDEIFSLSLTDAKSNRIFYQTHQKQQLTLPLDLRALPAGTYFLTVQTESGSFVKKVLKGN
jgi:glucose/arabinose dehydrogenase